jgi:hypothetical protein
MIGLDPAVLHALERRMTERQEKEQALRTRLRATTNDPAVPALMRFIDTLELNGGVFPDGQGEFAPVADPEWMDLADAYFMACQALGLTPCIVPNIALPVAASPNAPLTKPPEAP